MQRCKRCTCTRKYFTLNNKYVRVEKCWRYEPPLCLNKNKRWRVFIVRARTLITGRQKRTHSTTLRALYATLWKLFYYFAFASFYIHLFSSLFSVGIFFFALRNRCFRNAKSSARILSAALLLRYVKVYIIFYVSIIWGENDNVMFLNPFRIKVYEQTYGWIIMRRKLTAKTGVVLIRRSPSEVLTRKKIIL